jgi:ATP synthase protein I
MGPTTNKNGERPFIKQVREKEKRKLQALNGHKNSVWFGLGMFGMVGWSIIVPTLLGTGLGIWLDKKYPVSFSWTLTLLIIGLFTGCGIAWHWIARESKTDHKKEEEQDE